MSLRKQRSAFDQVSEFDKGRIVVYRDCALSFREICSCFGRNQTTQSGLSARRPLLGLPLTQNHRRLRCQWCDERRMCVAEWNKVVFTEDLRMSTTPRWSDSSLETPWREDSEQLPYAKPHWPCTRYYGMGRNWISLSHSSSTHYGTLSSQCYISDVLEPAVLPYLQGLPQSYFNRIMRDNTWHVLSIGLRQSPD
ncbi:transposable element Tcb1 transposase [Trichonephila clavipes]|nr:transposable element Tcb1 transposase [Trichonephila clavipes]